MRLLLAQLIAALPLTAAAQPKRPAFETTVVNFPETQNVVGSVEITNLPDVQDVNVVNAPTTGSSTGWHTVGVTSSAFIGNLGGPWGANAACNEEFPLSDYLSSREEARS